MAPPLVVLDPVMVATSGDRLLTEDAEQALRDLLARVHLVTPNIPELAILAGAPVATSWAAVLRQAQQVAETHGVLVLAKGGHLAGDSVPDALVDARHRAGVSRGADRHPEHPRHRVFLLLRRGDPGGGAGRRPSRRAGRRTQPAGW